MISSTASLFRFTATDKEMHSCPNSGSFPIHSGRRSSALHVKNVHHCDNFQFARTRLVYVTFVSEIEFHLFRAAVIYDDGDVLTQKYYASPLLSAKLQTVQKKYKSV